MLEDCSTGGHGTEIAVLINVRNVQATLIAQAGRDVQDTVAYPDVQADMLTENINAIVHPENDSRRISFDLNDVMNWLYVLLTL